MLFHVTAVCIVITKDKKRGHGFTIVFTVGVSAPHHFSGLPAKRSEVFLKSVVLRTAHCIHAAFRENRSLLGTERLLL